MITTQRTHTYKWPLCLVYCALGLCYTDQLYSTSSLELKEHLIGSILQKAEEGYKKGILQNWSRNSAAVNPRY